LSGTQTFNVTGNITGNLSGSVGSVTAAITLPSIPTNWITAAGINASALNGKGDGNIGKTGYSLTQTFPTNFSALGISVGGHISNVDTLTTYTGDTPQTGDGFARIGAAGAGLTALGDTRIANLDATISSRLAASGYTAPPSTADIVTAFFSNAIETSMTLLGYLRGTGAVLLGKISGGATNTNVIRNAVDDTKVRVTATVDADGNRSSITTDLT